MTHKGIILFIWFPVTFLLVLLDIFFLRTIHIKQNAPVAYSPPNTYSAQSISVGSEQVLGATITAGDARELLLKKFLTKHSSPLTEFSHYIVQRADFYGIDYLLVPAIAMCESIGGKRMPSRPSHNAWGISVETGEMSGANFHNWMFAIDWVSKYIRDEYIHTGLTDPVAMGAKWAPSSVEKGNSWAHCVEFFMDEIQI